ncbi:DUF1697 domain-containing protein [Aquabacterium sp.]|uniref:DUF1697 domain-containing protein n=1 Tax=Aquabacterium sp. TaxID=1872578 RepID=UPI002C9CB9C4|nr:DUF1697 domain-containing protein [Aquabacterium sp.]HSW06875.1 DUF1697 domain-containing protein [Aquabacterium sp.]
MKFAAFFRNLNLGRARAPTKAQFEDAFRAAGAANAASFLVNGTMAFEATSRRRALQIVRAACTAMHASCGLVEPAFIRSLDALAALVASDPFQAVDRSTVYACCVTFLHDDLVLPDEPPLANSRKNVEVIAYTAAEMLSVAHQFGSSPGSPNLFAEKAFGLPATTRAWSTVCRLVQRHG